MSNTQSGTSGFFTAKSEASSAVSTEANEVPKVGGSSGNSSFTNINMVLGDYLSTASSYYEASDINFNKYVDELNNNSTKMREKGIRVVVDSASGIPVGTVKYPNTNRMTCLVYLPSVDTSALSNIGADNVPICSTYTALEKHLLNYIKNRGCECSSIILLTKEDLAKSHAMTGHILATADYYANSNRAPFVINNIDRGCNIRFSLDGDAAFADIDAQDPHVVHARDDFAGRIMLEPYRANPDTYAKPQVLGMFSGYTNFYLCNGIRFTPLITITPYMRVEDPEIAVMVLCLIVDTVIKNGIWQMPYRDLHSPQNDSGRNLGLYYFNNETNLPYTFDSLSQVDNALSNMERPMVVVKVPRGRACSTALVDVLTGDGGLQFGRSVNALLGGNDQHVAPNYNPPQLIMSRIAGISSHGGVQVSTESADFPHFVGADPKAYSMYCNMLQPVKDKSVQARIIKSGMPNAEFYYDDDLYVISPDVVELVANAIKNRAHVNNDGVSMPNVVDLNSFASAYAFNTTPNTMMYGYTPYVNFQR